MIEKIQELEEKLLLNEQRLKLFKEGTQTVLIQNIKQALDFSARSIGQYE